MASFTKYKKKEIISFLSRAAFYAVLGIFLLQADLFNINERSDAAYQDAFYKLAAPFYPSNAQQDIAIVLINDKSIDSLYNHGQISANEWPIQYADHSEVLNKILGYKPKAIFADIYFKKERSTDPTFKQLSLTINRAHRRDTPLLFAGGFIDEELTDIQRKLNKHNGLTLNGWEGFGEYYPLSVEHKTTAAFDLYRTACLQENPLPSCTPPLLNDSQLDANQAISVNWGSKGVTPASIERTGTCNTSGYSILSMLSKGLLEGFAGQSSDHTQPLCDYHPVIYADELFAITKRDCNEVPATKAASCKQEKTTLRNTLENRIVLYGVHLEGLQDLIDSPVHGKVPGLFYHSMALDNLISQGTAVTKASDDTMELITNLTWVGIVLTVLLGHKLNPVTDSNNPQASWRSIAGLRRRFQLYFFGAIPLLIGTYLSFFTLHYEPVNALTFISMVMLMVELIRQEFAARMLTSLLNSYKRLKSTFVKLLKQLKNIPKKR